MSTPYFPKPNGPVDCAKCELEHCVNRGRFQRTNRDFTVLSGRCPRLPDRRGLVDSSQKAEYREGHTFVTASRRTGALVMRLYEPGQRVRAVYPRARGGFYTVKAFEEDGRSRHRRINVRLEGCGSGLHLASLMERLHTQTMCFLAEVE